MWISYSDGINFALLIFSLWSSFIYFRGFIHRGYLFPRNSSWEVFLGGNGRDLPFPKNLSPMECLQSEDACSQSHAGMLCWLMASMLSTVHGSSLPLTDPRATSIAVNIWGLEPLHVVFFSYLSLNKLWKWISSPLNYFLAQDPCFWLYWLKSHSWIYCPLWL